MAHGSFSLRRAISRFTGNLRKVSIFLELSNILFDNIWHFIENIIYELSDSLHVSFFVNDFPFNSDMWHELLHGVWQQMPFLIQMRRTSVIFVLPAINVQTNYHLSKHDKVRQLKVKRNVLV